MIFLSETNKFTAFGVNMTKGQKEKEEKKENKKRIRTSFERWENFKNNRPNDRRFYTDKW
jgi:hypothetical protein